MRTLIDITNKQIEELAAISQEKKVSRAEVIRQAIAAYIISNKPSTETAFGLWVQKPVDGVEYQKRERSEW